MDPEYCQATLADIPCEDIFFLRVFSRLSVQDLENLAVAIPDYCNIIDSYYNKVKSIQLETVTPDVLRALSQKTSSLRELDLQHNSSLSDDILKNFLQRNKDLVSLNVSSCPYLTECGVQQIKNLKNLTTLYARRSYWVKNDILDLFTSNLDYLQKIDFSMSMVDDASLVPFFRKFKRLTVIELEKVPYMSDVTLYAIAENCKEVSFINLRGNKTIGEESVRSIASNCKMLLTMLVRGCINLSANFLEWLEDTLWSCDAP